MSCGMLYSEKVLEHFINPRNVGEIPDADGVGTIGDPMCGDYLSALQARREHLRSPAGGSGYLSNELLQGSRVRSNNEMTA